ncbi:manganese ABC transporter [Paenibacillus oryzae]|uniref:Manganese transport system membrane protein MntC n=1 Tax=Paenibacillus oryzae TaxID=1844972 RepID=A0A1A5YFN6_9BACL|nr:iron chelate uptake ABC transporter family permease subunit [Paenibacillus oryzae]OBR64398.1 manganese ABC transporter [Paenibacillus oryzae]
MNNFFAMLGDPNMRWIFLGCMLLGLSSGVIGSFSYLRKQSLVGDTLAHAALPGICIAFMLTGVKSIGVFLVGAAAAGFLATFGISFITRHTKLKQDAALGIVLSSFFGLGIVLLTFIQHGDYGNQAGLDKFLFGQAAAMVGGDVITMSVISAVLVGICSLLFKQFKLISFDPGFAKGLGYRVGLLEQLLMLLVVVAVVIGIQAVGVVLIAALLITPAVSARYWTNTLGIMVTLSGMIGALSGGLGAWISSSVSNLPTGPVTVLAATLFFAASVLLGPERGLLAKWLLRQKVKRSYHAEREVRIAEAMKGESVS